MDPAHRPDAILIVHGIGEQITNDTARSLATALAGTDGTGSPHRNRVRSGADLAIDGAKQRVYTIVWDIEADTVSPETQVSEGYWAYRFRDTTWSHVTGWLIPLVTRRRSDMPDRLRVGAAWVSNATVAAAGLLGLATVIGVWAAVPLGGWLAETGYDAALVLGALALLLGLFVYWPRRAVPRRVMIGVAAVVALVVALTATFGQLSDWDAAPVLTAIPAVGLGVFALAALAEDVLTSARVLAVVTTTIVLCLLGLATDQDSTSTTVLALVASAAAPWATAAAAALLLPALGDAARYFRDHPSNEDDSRRIRKIVIDKLRELHRLENGRPRFRRVIVIGHSLGSVIAYDAINHFWAETSRGLSAGGPPDCDTCRARDAAVLALESAAHDLVCGVGDDVGTNEAVGKLEAYRGAQWELSAALRDGGGDEHRLHLFGEDRTEVEQPWLVTDFITLGSPLASIGFLGEPGRHRPSPSSGPTPTSGGTGSDPGSGLEDAGGVRTWFESKLASREYPSCPPLSQTAAALDPLILFSRYPLRYPRRQRGQGDRARQLHHAAAFASTRWTNVYFQNDLVGGPVSAQLGRGILDIELTVAPPTPRNFAALFSHTSYWTEPTVGKLETPALKSRQVLIDLIERHPGHASTVAEVAGIDGRSDLVWTASSPAQSAAVTDVEFLESQRRAAFGQQRRDLTWRATLERLAGDSSPDLVELAGCLERIRSDFGDRCLAFVTFGEVAVYRLAGTGVDLSGYRTVQLGSEHGLWRCRAHSLDIVGWGADEYRDLEATEAWIAEFVAAEPT